MLPGGNSIQARQKSVPVPENHSQWEAQKIFFATKTRTRNIATCDASAEDHILHFDCGKEGIMINNAQTQLKYFDR